MIISSVIYSNILIFISIIIIIYQFIEKLREMSAEVAKNFGKNLRESAKNFKSAITPDVVRRVVSRYNFKKDVVDAETKIEETFIEIEKTIEEEYTAFQNDKAEAAKRAAKIKRNKAGEDMQHYVQHAHEEEQKKLDFTEYHARRDKQIQEREEKFQREVKRKEEKIEREDTNRRVWRTNFWSDQAKTLSAENIKLKTELYAKLAKEYDTSLDGLSDEWVHRDLSRARNQTEGPKFSKPIELPGRELGVFGIPLGPGEFAAPDGGYLPGLDQHDIHVFDGAPQTDFDRRQIDFIDKETELKRQEQLYESISEENKKF